MMKKGNSAKTYAKEKRVAFKFNAVPHSEIFMAGTFNQWDPGQHQMKDVLGNGKYAIVLMLPAGEYQYKFIVNGVWVVDPECQSWVRNQFGTLNNVIKVG